MMRAFYEDAHWASLWKGMPLDSIISDCARRLPWNLVRVTSLKRHRKVVENNTGNVVGYARWIIPNGLDDKWNNGIVSETDPEGRQDYEEDFRSVTIDGEIRGLDHRVVEELSEAIEQAEAQILGTGERFLSQHSNVTVSICLG
jgi:hypothetical protein